MLDEVVNTVIDRDTNFQCNNRTKKCLISQNIYEVYKTVILYFFFCHLPQTIIIPFALMSGSSDSIYFVLKVMCSISPSS